MGDEVQATADIEIGGDTNTSERAWLKQFIWSRGREPQRTQLVEEYVLGVLDTENVTLNSGMSKRTASGESIYLMVHDQGPRRFGAVAYVTPSSGKLDFRLLEEDVEDVRQCVTLRTIREGRRQHPYRIDLGLRTNDDVNLALELTRRALEKVRD